MDKLSVKTTQTTDGTFTTQWRWRQSGAKQPLAGEIAVRLDESYRHDRAIIAELGAIQYLLDQKGVHGSPNRQGAGIRIEVSFGAIRKALLKGALKKSDQGDTEKKHVAGCATFLATKYFEADIAVWRKWKDDEPRTFEKEEIVVPASFPGSAVFCHLLGEEIFITRHAMRRQIVRVDTNNKDKPKPVSDDDLSNIPDKWWGTAWRWFESIFKEGSSLKLASLLPKSHAKYVKKYGPGSQYLWHPDSQGVAVVKRDRDSLVAVTVIHEKHVDIEREPVQVGQKLVSRREHHRRSLWAQA